MILGLSPIVPLGVIEVLEEVRVKVVRLLVSAAAATATAAAATAAAAASDLGVEPSNDSGKIATKKCLFRIAIRTSQPRLNFLKKKRILFPKFELTVPVVNTT